MPVLRNADIKLIMSLSTHKHVWLEEGAAERVYVEAIAGGMPATGVSQDVETGKLESTIHSLPIPGLSVLTMM